MARPSSPRSRRQSIDSNRFSFDEEEINRLPSPFLQDVIHMSEANQLVEVFEGPSIESLEDFELPMDLLVDVNWENEEPANSPPRRAGHIPATTPLPRTGSPARQRYRRGKRTEALDYAWDTLSKRPRGAHLLHLVRSGNAKSNVPLGAVVRLFPSRDQENTGQPKTILRLSFVTTASDGTPKRVHLRRMLTSESHLSRALGVLERRLLRKHGLVPYRRDLSVLRSMR